MLKALLPGIEFETAINTIEVISHKTEDKQMYDTREKAERDYQWILAAQRAEGREEGIEKGLEKGELVGEIRTLQRVLGDSLSAREELHALSHDELQARIGALQQRLHDRPSS